MNDKISNIIDRLANKLRPYVPFTVLNTVIRNLDKNGQSILDIGCGRGTIMQIINKKKRWRTTGVDIFVPYIEEAKSKKTHDSYILCDIRNLNIPDKSYDIVLCMEVLEHLEREDGLELLKKLEKIARRQIILSTPQGDYAQHAIDGNEHQEHKAIWSVTDLKKLGYSVRGQGVPGIGGESGFASHLPDALVPFTNIPYVLAGPVVYFCPKLAGAMVAIKKLS